METSSSPAGSGSRALAHGDPSGSVTPGLHSRGPGFVGPSIAPGSARSFPRGEGRPRCRPLERGDAPGGRCRGQSRAPGKAGKCRRGVPAGGRPEVAASAGAAGRESGQRFRGGGCPGEGREGGRGNEPPAAVTEALTFTPALATAPFRASWSVWETQPPSPPRLIKSLAVGRYFHIQAGQNRNADQLL